MADSDEPAEQREASNSDQNGQDPASETKSDDKKCPECGEPIDNLRASCPECGYEYNKDDYDDKEAGNEYLAGSNIDDEGEEITDEGPGAEEGAE